MKRIVVGLSLVLAMAVASCNFKRQTDAKFGDQNFKTAVALVELYKIRHGVFPERLSDIDFLGEWDRLPIVSVAYSRLPDGYELNLTRGWVGKPELRYPPDFWKGLGLKKSNVKP